MKTESEPSMPEDAFWGVRIWLWSVFLMVLTMVAIGGITRLTGSGLSMVEWHPLMGALPPLDDATWQAVFARYQESPQYQLVNDWMLLADFKRIFFWEYLHRLLGRSVGLVFFLPWAVFIARGKIRGRLLGATTIALLLGGAQGLMGWYMVKSGLVDRPEVSHFRLAAHLSLAFLVALWVLWIILNLRPKPSTAMSNAAARTVPPIFKLSIWVSASLLLVQVVYGALMAGKRAGWISPTFPDMNGHYLPGVFFGDNILHDALHNGQSIHYIHRLLGWALLFSITWVTLQARWSGLSRDLRKRAHHLAVIVGVQFTLGALTVVFHVPTWLAVVHQCGALILLSAMIYLAHGAGMLGRLQRSSMPTLKAAPALALMLLIAPASLLTTSCGGDTSPADGGRMGPDGGLMTGRDSGHPQPLGCPGGIEGSGRHRLFTQGHEAAPREDGSWPFLHEVLPGQSDATLCDDATFANDLNGDGIWQPGEEPHPLGPSDLVHGEHFLVGTGSFVEFTATLCADITGDVTFYIPNFDVDGSVALHQLYVVHEGVETLIAEVTDDEPGSSGYNPFVRVVSGVDVDAVPGDTLLLRSINVSGASFSVMVWRPPSEYESWIQIEVP